ncbi:MAG: hypothetical protein V3S26_10110 [Acidimicrobiia bacterium]
MRRSILLLAIVGMLVAALAIPALARTTGRGNGPIIYVESQDLFYDSIVVADLPFNGQDNWQLLEATVEPGADLQTYSGPGDTDYFGGRWYRDTDGTPGLSEGDTFFLCPLLGPGRAAA